MKFFLFTTAAFLSLAVMTSAQAAPSPSAGANPGQDIAQLDLRFAQNDQTDKGWTREQKNQKQGAPAAVQNQPRGGQGAQERRAPVGQGAPQQLQRQHPQQQQQLQRQQMQKQQFHQTSPVRVPSQQPTQIQRHQLQPTSPIRVPSQQPTQVQRQHVQRQQLQSPQRYNWSAYQPGRRPPDWNRYSNFNRGAWQGAQTATRRYHWTTYHRPHGWYYRRWSYGMILPSLFWGRQYWIDSYWNYGLPNPPYGYVWVRYGNDALLVDVETGAILRVVYGLYY